MKQSHIPAEGQDDPRTAGFPGAPGAQSQATDHDAQVAPPTHAATTDGADASSMGATLRAARQARGLELETCAQALRLPARVLRKLEADDHTGIDCQVYLRGYLTKYGAYLGLPAATIEQELARQAPARQEPQLVSTGGISRSRFLLERYATAATYVVLTAVIVVPMVWLGLKGGLDRELVRLAPLDAAPVGQQAAENPAEPGARTDDGAAATTATQATAGEHPLMASMAPFAALDNVTADMPVQRPRVAAAAGGHRIGISLSSPSWVEVIAADGQRLEYALLPAGTDKTYHSSTPVEINIGNASAAQVSIDGNSVDIHRYQRANVAHFRVALEDGKAVPASM